MNVRVGLGVGGGKFVRVVAADADYFAGLLEGRLRGHGGHCLSEGEHGEYREDEERMLGLWERCTVLIREARTCSEFCDTFFFWRLMDEAWWPRVGAQPWLFLGWGSGFLEAGGEEV